MVKFYRGLYSSYDYNKATNTGKHVDCVYFATDVGRILMNGTEFGSPVDISLLNSVIKDVSISNNVLTFTLGDDTTFDITIPAATSTTDGVMSSADKSKLDSIESGALKNTITGVKGDSESTYRTGNVNITADNIGLGNVDNTSDANKPISTALLAALDKKVDKVSGKGLSTNDYTTEDKNKLSGIAAGATANEGTITGIKMNGVSKGTSGIVDLGTVIISHQDISGKLNVSLKGTANGLAELDSNGKVPSSQLPSYVDDVLEYSSKSVFPTTGESGKIYIDTTTNLSYRWGGTTYVEISPSLALGETASTAYRGDRGKTAYDHSQSAHARTDATKVEKSSTNGNIKINGTETTVYTHPSGTNPHGTTKSDVGLGNVGNFKAVSTVASLGLTDTEKANARANIGAGTSSFSGSYNDLSNKPNIPTVGNGTITITQNGATRGTFTTNQSGNTTIALTDDNTWRGIQDNLASSSSTESLSANQGRILNLTKVGFAKVSAAEIAKTNNNPFFGNVENEDIGIGNGNYYSVINLGSYSGGNFRSQIAMPYQDSIADSDIYIRTDKSGTWRAWRKLIHSGNIGSQNVNYANSAGSVAWGNISGKPGSFTPASHTHDYLPLSGGTITGPLTIDYNHSGGGTTNSLLNVLFNGSHDYGIVAKFHSYGSDSPAIRFSHSTDKGEYNSQVNTNWSVGMRASTTTDFAITQDRGTSGWGTVRFAINNNGNVGIGVDSASYKLHVAGDVYTTTGFKKEGSSDSYVLLGGGGHKAVGDFATSGHTHNYLPLSGGTMTGNITYTGHGTSYIGNGANDAANGVGGALNNLVISSWYGVSFTTSCNGTPYTGTNAVSINCRNGHVYANTFVGNLSGNAATATTATTATKVAATVTGANGTELVRGNIADNDFFRIYVGGTGSNSGYAEIATADDGNEPIYVRQYIGTFSNLVRTLTLLDGNGNTTAPGTITSTGFIKSGSSDLYVLLGGGGHRGINDHSHTGAQVTMGGYSTLSGGYVTTSDTVNSAINKIEDLLLWYELN